MINWPHTYYINRWCGNGGEDTALMYRTNDVNDFIEHVEKEIAQNGLTSKNSKVMIRGDKTFFSYFVGFGERAWKSMRYMTPPDKVYNNFEDYKRRIKKELKCQSSPERRISMTA